MGYCRLCRTEEINKYGTLARTLKQHREACDKAGCKHPPEYWFSEKNENISLRKRVSPKPKKERNQMRNQNKTKQHTLDRNTQEQVDWYADFFGRNPRDVINGIIAGTIERLREGFSEMTRECCDNSAGVIEEDVIAARRRRHAH